LQSIFGSFGLNDLSLRDVDFVYHNQGSKVQTTLSKLNVSLKDILINQDTERDTSRFLYAKDATIDLKNFTHKTADSLYTFILDSITVFAARSELKVQSLKVQPRFSLPSFMKRVSASIFIIPFLATHEGMLVTLDMDALVLLKVISPRCMVSGFRSIKVTSRFLTLMSLIPMAISDANNC